MGRVAMRPVGLLEEAAITPGPAAGPLLGSPRYSESNTPMSTITPRPVNIPIFASRVIRELLAIFRSVGEYFQTMRIVFLTVSLGCDCSKYRGPQLGTSRPRVAVHFFFAW